jgi:hypothetical protein
MKKMIALIGLLAGTGAFGAHAATTMNAMPRAGHAKTIVANKTHEPVRDRTPFSCTISVTGSVSAGFGSISATCAATEATCSLATVAATSCLSSVLRSLKARLT